MKIRKVTAAFALAAASAFVVLPACETSNDSGIKTNYRSQWTRVNTDTETATQVTEEVFEELELKEIKATSTKVDGKVRGKTADGRDVVVDIEKDGQLSQVAVNIGSIGDPDMGEDIIRRIRQKVRDQS